MSKCQVKCFSSLFPIWFSSGFPGVILVCSYVKMEQQKQIKSYQNGVHLVLPAPHLILGGIQAILPLRCHHFFPFLISFFNILFMHLFLAVLGLRCRTGFFFSCGKWELLQSRCAGFSLWWLLLFQSMGSRAHGFNTCSFWALEHRLNSCGAWAQLLHGMWDPPRSGIKPVSSALADGLSTTEHQGSSLLLSNVNVTAATESACVSSLAPHCLQWPHLPPVEAQDTLVLSSPLGRRQQIGYI